MCSGFYRPLKVVALNANGIGKLRFGLRKEMQDRHVDVALLSATHLKCHERFFIPNYHFYRNDRFSGLKGRPAVAVRKGIQHNHVDQGSAYRLEIAKFYL
jgi:hypothetical protein